MAYSEDMSKETLIKKEVARLRKVFKNLDKNKFNVVQKLIESAAFMAVSLKELEDIINAHGYSESYQNGKFQKGKKKTPEVELHISMLKNYSTVIKQLTELVPLEERKQTKLQLLRDE